MFPFALFFLVASLVLFLIAAIWNPAPPSPWFGRIVAAGLACWVLVDILTRLPSH